MISVCLATIQLSNTQLRSKIGWSNYLGWETVRSEPLNWIEFVECTVDSECLIHSTSTRIHLELVCDDSVRIAALRKSVC